MSGKRSQIASPVKWTGLAFLWLSLLSPPSAKALETEHLRAPQSNLVTGVKITDEDSSTSTFGSILMGSVRWFQHWVSPIDGPRCSFSPTCSQFGYEAVDNYGPALGVIMTADRLMRCTYWTEPGTDYARLPNGALYDPVQANRLANP